MTRAQLISARLTLRPVLETDRAAVVAALNDLRVSRWLSSIPHPYGEADFDYFMNNVAIAGKTFAIEGAQGFVGICGIETQLGYWLVPSAWGQGYAKEAAQWVLADHFSKGADPVLTYAFADNAPSRHILARLGFVQTGQGTKMCRALGEARPHIEMSLTYADFIAALPVQSSARLTYRNLMPHDAPALHKIVSQWDVVRQLGSWPWPADYDQTLARAVPYAGEGLVWGIFLHGALIGTLGITKGNLGYFIDPAHQRRGYAREAIAHAMAQSGLAQIEAEVWEDNPASLALLHSLGFAETGRREQLSKARGIRLGTIRLTYSAPHP